MQQADMSTTTFEPETIIEINDTMRGFRKLAIVVGAGNAYVDLLDDDTPFPDKPLPPAFLAPAPSGDPLSWSFALADKGPEAAGAFNELMESLLGERLDSLTYYRALKWAFDHHEFDAGKAIQAGREATAKVRESRDYMDHTIAGATA